MILNFKKYQGTGNDFIIADNRDRSLDALPESTIQFLCDRHRGIGADGLMLLQEKEGYDFEMKYFNADGREGSMCGNGGRCIALFAKKAGIQKQHFHFLAIDGPHEAHIRSAHVVALRMKDVNCIQEQQGDFMLNTGSPHIIRFVQDIEQIDVVKEGRAIRFSKAFEAEGINVNFVETKKGEGSIQLRTYERGVENETLSCGTGATAAALVCFHNENGLNNLTVKTRGGNLQIEYIKMEKHQFNNIWLCGSVHFVFEGSIDLATLNHE
ncbi:MAG: diaminopimelate epimerase [Bacteroidetes bacterium]|nr:diaminopimelate epimerase [Bacteroidota bacterium]